MSRPKTRCRWRWVYGDARDLPGRPPTVVHPRGGHRRGACRRSGPDSSIGGRATPSSREAICVNFYSPPASRNINVDGCRPSVGPVQCLSIMSILLWFDPCAVECFAATAFLQNEHSSTPTPRPDLLHLSTSTKRVESVPRRQSTPMTSTNTPTRGFGALHSGSRPRTGSRLTSPRSSDSMTNHTSIAAFRG